MKVNGFIRRGVAHLLSVLMILSTLSMGLTALGAVGPQEAYAEGSAPEIIVAIDSANEQPATGGSYRWAFFGADGDIDLEDLSADDFSMQVKAGDGEWTAATGVTVELKAADDYDGVVEAAVPDNTEAVAKQWRFTYAGGILDWGYSEADCPAITQAAAAAQVIKPSNVYMFRGDGLDEFQPASGGTFAWDAMNADYTLYDPMAEMVTAEDFKLQTKKVTEPDTAWADVEGATLTLTETEEDDTVKITATIADNEDDYDKHWRVVYKHSAVELQVESCSSIQITQMKPEAAADPEITKIEYDKTEYSDDVTVTASLTGTGLDTLTADDFKLEFDGEGWGDYMVYNYGNIAVNPAADGNSADVTFNLSKGNKAYRFTVNNYVAGSVTNNPQVFKFKEPPAKAYTKAEFNATEFTSEGGTLTVTLTGENLNLAAAADFKLYVPDTEYGGDMDSNIRADYAAADDGLSGTATFTLPANTGEEDVEYTFNIVKKIQYGMPFFYTADEVTGAKTKIKVKAPAAAPAEKPVIGDVYILSGNTQPAAGGTYSWAFYGIDDTVDWSGVTSADFSAQVKAGDGEWSASDATVTLSSNDEYDGVVTISVPDNDQEVEKQWRFTYAGGIVDYYDNPADCPAIKQAAAEPAPAEKPALVISADDESVSADGGEISWFVQSYDGSDLEGAVTSADFTVQMNAGDGWVGKDDVSATFEIGNNDDEGEVKVNVPSNNEEKEKSWRLVYSGDLYAHEGEALKPAECPAITQAAKDPVAEAKTTAKAELAAYRDAKDNAEYDDEGVATLNAAKEAGDSAIEAAATTDAVATALENAKEAIDGVMTKAQKEAASLAEAKERAKEELNGIDTSKYSGEEKAAVEKAIEDGLKAVEEAGTKENVAAAVNAAKSAIAQQKTDEQKAAEAQAKAAEEKAKATPSVTVSGSTVTADSIAAAIAAAGGSNEYVTELVLDKSVKKVGKNALAGTKVTTLIVKTKKLKKKSVKGSLKGSSVTTVKVQIGKAKTNKKYVKKYKKIFTKKNAGKKVKVKK